MFARSTGVVTLFAVILSVILLGCSSDVKKEDELKRLIGVYADALEVAYRDGEFERLDECAGNDVFQSAGNTYQSYLNGFGVYLDSKLIGITFESVSPGSDEDDDKVKAVWNEDEKEWKEILIYRYSVVVTKERWNYKWILVDTNEIASPLMEVEYTMNYNIDNEGGKLKVVKAVIVKEDILKSEGDMEKWRKLKGEGGVEFTH